MYKTMTSHEDCEELIPLITYHGGIKRLFFHYPKTDELYVLKNASYHRRLTMFGSFRYIYVDEANLVSQGKKADLIP